MSSYETRKRKKELDELRKLGVAPAAEDADGFYVNPHIPAYMADAPFYMNDGNPGLQHQRLKLFKQGIFGEKTYDSIHKIVKRGVKKSRASTYVHGACENCGARTHKAKDCVERPRKYKAKFTGKNIAPDEYLPEKESLNWDGKRDPYRNFDVNRYQFEQKKWHKVEEMRKKKREEELHKKMKEGDAKERKRAEKKLNKLKNKGEGSKKEGADSDSDSDSDSDVDSDDSDEDVKDSGQVITTFDIKKRQTVRNLRIREDFPKYLRVLDPDGAYFDPKARSMRADPYTGKGAEDVTPMDDYRGDIATLRSGDVEEFNELNNFTAKAQKHHGDEKAGNMLIFSNPTSTELAFRDFKEKKKKKVLNKELLNKYGGQEHLKKPKDHVLHGQSEVYVEYLPDGREKERPKLVPKSKYVEDEHPNDHSSIWGSYFDRKEMTWGYACCKATTYSAYCTAQKIEKVETKKDKVVELKKKPKRMVTVTAKPSDYFEESKKTLEYSGYVAVRGVKSEFKRKLGNKAATLAEPAAKRQKNE